MTDTITPTDGMIITHDMTFAPGVYLLPNGIRIAADGITLRGDATHIISPQQTGVGLRVEGQRGVSVIGLHISGFYHGIRADDCTDLTIENVTIRNTYEIEGITTFLNLWQPLDEAYGGAVLLNRVRDSVVRGCDLQHQMHGVQLYECERVRIEQVNASFNSGWGVYLSTSHECHVENNQLDFCNRLFRRADGEVRVEADAPSEAWRYRIAMELESDLAPTVIEEGAEAAATLLGRASQHPPKDVS
ncbi:MAG: hypothetical protein HC828_14235 [Blastochloris sp.]|nr:hypothetical protein [Blastochloris sp.]